MENRDETLWRVAKKRAAFKRHLFAYIIVNAFLWLMWFFQYIKHDSDNSFPWPIFVTIGWGIGLAFSYRDAYSDEDTLAQKEYDKLINKK